MNAAEANAVTIQHEQPAEQQTNEFFEGAMKEIYSDIQVTAEKGLRETSIYQWEGSGILHHIVQRLQSEGYVVGPLNVREGSRTRHYNLGNVQW